MTTPPPRKRFQIHLSTAIVMMFVAGALIWANCIAHIRVNSRDWVIGDGRDGVWDNVSLQYGWPFKIATTNTFLLAEQPYSIDTLRNQSLEYYHSMALCNVGVGLAFVTAIGFLCERLIRRRAARKGA